MVALDFRACNVNPGQSVRLGQHGWPLELTGQRTQVEHVACSLAKSVGLPAAPDQLESGPQISPQSSLVVVEDPQHDVVQTQRIKSIVEQQHGGLGPVAAAPTVTRANQEAKLTGAVSEVEVEQTGVADWPPGDPLV